MLLKLANLDDSDSDFEVIGGLQNDVIDDDADFSDDDSEINSDEARTKAEGKKDHGKDIEWLEFESFANAEELKNF